MRIHGQGSNDHYLKVTAKTVLVVSSYNDVPVIVESKFKFAHKILKDTNYYFKPDQTLEIDEQNSNTYSLKVPVDFTSGFSSYGVFAMVEKFHV